MTFPMSRYCPTLYSNQNYCPSTAYRKYRRVQAVSTTGFEYFNPRSLAIARPGDMACNEPSITQTKYEAVNRRVRERSSSRSRASVSNDRWSVGPGDIPALSVNPDMKLARSRMSTIGVPTFEDYPPVRAQSNQYEQLTHQLIRYGALRGKLA